MLSWCDGGNCDAVEMKKGRRRHFGAAISGVTRRGRRWKIDIEFCVFFCDVQQNPSHLNIIGRIFERGGGFNNMIGLGSAPLSLFRIGGDR